MTILTMRAAVLAAPGKILIQQVPRPAATAAHEVVAEVCYAGICRTDLQLAQSGMESPRVLGHEVVCRLPDETGYLVLNNEIGCGTCGYCRENHTSHCPDLDELGVNADGGYAEWIKVPHRRQLHPFRFEDPVLGVLVEPLSCALHAEQRLRRLRPAGVAHPSVLIVGGGVSGALIGYLLSHRPEQPRIQLLDCSPAELDWPAILGVQRVAEPEGLSHLVVECTGTPEGCLTAFQSVRAGGVVCLYGVPGDGAPLAWTADRIFHHEVTVLPSYAGSTVDTIRSAIELVRKDEPFFQRLIGRRVALEELSVELATWRPAPGTRTVVDFER